MSREERQLWITSKNLQILWFCLLVVNLNNIKRELDFIEKDELRTIKRRHHRNRRNIRIIDKTNRIQKLESLDPLLQLNWRRTKIWNKNAGWLFMNANYFTSLRSIIWEHFKSNPPVRAMKLLIIKSVNVPSVSNRYPFMKNPTINPSP